MIDRMRHALMGLLLVMLLCDVRRVQSFIMPFPIIFQQPAHCRQSCRARSAGKRFCLAAGSQTSGERLDRQRIAVVGSGAVGLYYGARLLEAGHDVSFVARSDLEVLKRDGLTVESVDGDMRFEEIKVYGKAQDIGEVDWVVIALKTYALPAVLFMPPCFDASPIALLCSLKPMHRHPPCWKHWSVRTQGYFLS